MTVLHSAAQYLQVNNLQYFELKTKRIQCLWYVSLKVFYWQWRWHLLPHLPLHGWWQYLCLLSKVRLNDCSWQCLTFRLNKEVKLCSNETHQHLRRVWKCHRFDCIVKQGREVKLCTQGYFQIRHCTLHWDSPWWKILVTFARKIVLKHHLILSMSSGDLNWILMVETVTNLQPLKNVLKRSWLSDYSNLWDSGLSGRSLAVNGRCSGSEWLERYRLYCARRVCVCGRFQRLLHACAGCVDCMSKSQSQQEVVRMCLVKKVWKN